MESLKFKQYKRKEIAELRPVTDVDIKSFEIDKHPHSLRDTQFKVSISDADLKNGSPKIGDMIARNPKNHNDQWLVAEQYFKDNFEELTQPNNTGEKCKCEWTEKTFNRDIGCFVCDNCNERI